MSYPGILLFPVYVLCWWHLEDILRFGQFTVSKSPIYDSGQLVWWALAESSLLVIKGFWCWAITSKLMGEVCML